MTDAGTRGEDVADQIIEMVRSGRYEYRQNDLHVDARKLVAAAREQAQGEERDVIGKIALAYQPAEKRIARILAYLKRPPGGAPDDGASQAALAAKDEEIARLKDFLWSEGYHIPGGCRDAGHDINYWRGDHCTRECSALIPPEKDS